MSIRRSISIHTCALAVATLVSACILAPRGLDEERDRADRAGAAYAEPRAALPELSDQPDWPAVLERAFRANGDLEAAFHAWRAALARVEVAAAWPNTRFELGYEVLFSADHLKSFDRQTFELGFDPTQSLSLPTKVDARARSALAAARAAGERFLDLKFELQRRVLSAWLDLALAGERLRIEREALGLLRLRTASTVNLVQAGGLQQELLRVELEARLAEDAIARTEAALVAERAQLNALLARAPEAPLEPPAALPEARPLAADDARLLALGSQANHELAALAHEVEARAETLVLARQDYLPDVSPSIGFTGSIAQFAGLAISFPSNFAALRAAVEAARSELASSAERLRQSRATRSGKFVATLIAMRDSERQVAFFTATVVPLAERARASSESAYASGMLRFAAWLDGQRTLLDVRLALAEARIAREKQLVELEALAGIDFETLTAGDGHDG